MIKSLFKVLKKIVLAALFIYGYNVIATPMETTVPINLITIIMVSLLGLPGLFGLIIFAILVC